MAHFSNVSNLREDDVMMPEAIDYYGEKYSFIYLCRKEKKARAQM